MPSDRRTLQRLATRQGISTAATRLFVERGFDRVTVDEIALAANVGRMTVFNHFPRKEDMFFDRSDEVMAMLRDSLQAPDAAHSPVERLRRVAHGLVVQNSPYVEFSEASQGFVAAIEASESLKARARGLRGELAQVLAVALSECVGLEPDDMGADYASTVLVATWTVALVQGHKSFKEKQDRAAAAATFLAIVDRGTDGLTAALAGTAYV